MVPEAVRGEAEQSLARATEQLGERARDDLGLPRDSEALVVEVAEAARDAEHHLRKGATLRGNQHGRAVAALGLEAAARGVGALDRVGAQPPIARALGRVGLEDVELSKARRRRVSRRLCVGGLGCVARPSADWVWLGWGWSPVAYQVVLRVEHLGVVVDHVHLVRVRVRVRVRVGSGSGLGSGSGFGFGFGLGR